MDTDRKTILVVDDSADVRLVCRVNLEYHGYAVREAENGDEALAIIKDEPPDLVLLDVMMPDLDGWQILSTLKGDTATAHIPVVMLTARTREADQIRGWRSGASDYIVKPFNPEVLVPTVHNALEHASEQEATRRDRLDLLRFTQRLLDRTGKDREGSAV